MSAAKIETSKERPILFSGPMVRAILEGRKTQTRRVVNRARLREKTVEDGSRLIVGGDSYPVTRLCPYGQPGDRLWVREAWQAIYVYVDFEASYGEDIQTAPYIPDAELDKFGRRWSVTYAASHPEEKVTPEDRGFPWRPSIHMPRWASRVLLEVTEVRVQRLQAISDSDAEAEGAFHTDYGRTCFHEGQEIETCPAPDDQHPQRRGWSMVETTSSDECLGGPRWAFSNLWEQLAKPGARWADNPWVWAVSFKVVKP